MSTNSENTQIQSNIPSNVDATALFKKFIHLSDDFESLKKSLSNKANHYSNILFNLLGYNYQGKIANPNILHLISEAYLLSVFEELKKENKDGVENLRYNELLSKVNWIIVQENTFINNIKILSGIFNTINPVLDNGRIFKMFLVNIQATKNDILKHNEHSLKNNNLTKEKFDEIWSDIFNTALNYTLNEFSPVEDKKKSLTMYHLFNEIKVTHPESFNQKAYIAEFLKRKHLTESESKEIVNYLEYFFNFALNNFDDLIKEVDLFNSNASSILFKISSLLSIRNIKKLYAKYLEIVSHYTEEGLKNARLEALLNFYKAAFEFIKSKSETQLVLVKNNYQSLKKWIDDNELAKDLKDYSFKIYEKAYQFTAIPASIVLDNVYQPLKTLAFSMTENGILIVINTAAMTQEKAVKLRESLFETIDKTFGIAKKALIGEEQLIKMHSDKDEYISIELNKKLFVVDPQKVTQLLGTIYDTVKNINPVETIKYTVNGSIETILNAKEFINNSYKKFLELANDDQEINRKEN